MASKELQLTTSGRSSLTLTLFGKTYKNILMDVMTNACCDIILGQKFLGRHQSVNFEFDGKEEILAIPAGTRAYASLPAAGVKSPKVFEHLAANCKLKATRSRDCSIDNQRFISSEAQRLLCIQTNYIKSEDIIEPSHSGWRVQVLVVRKQQKCRLVVDYSKTINRDTFLDAYPLSKIEISNKVRRDRFYRSLYLQSAYHQQTWQPDERLYTAFEALGQLYQCNRIPFGVTNEASALQSVMNQFIKRHNLKKVYVYLDNLTVTGSSLEERDRNFETLLKAAARDGFTFNEKRSNFRQPVINLLGYEITYGKIKTNPMRLKPLMEMPPPSTPKEH